jgi:hypothetical protein
MSCCAASCCLWTGTARSQESLQEEFQPVHWAFSSLFGTGWYQIDGNREVYVLRVSPRQYVRE